MFFNICFLITNLMTTIQYSGTVTPGSFGIIWANSIPRFLNFKL